MHDAGHTGILNRRQDVEEGGRQQSRDSGEELDMHDNSGVIVPMTRHVLLFIEMYSIRESFLQAGEILCEFFWFLFQFENISQRNRGFKGLNAT